MRLTDNIVKKSYDMWKSFDAKFQEKGMVLYIYPVENYWVQLENKPKHKDFLNLI